jgi:hypothetical protein
MARPLVGHRELHLDRSILTTEFGETRPHPFQRRLRRQSFAGRSGAGEKRLDPERVNDFETPFVMRLASKRV